MVVQDNFGGCIYQLSNSNHGAKNNVPHPMSPPIHSNVFHYILLFGVDITTQRLYKTQRSTEPKAMLLSKHTKASDNVIYWLHASCGACWHLSR